MNEAFITDWAACGIDYGMGQNAFTAVPPKSTEAVAPVLRRPGRPRSAAQKTTVALMTDAERQTARILRNNANTFVFSSATEADKAKAFRLTGKSSAAGFERGLWRLPARF